MNTDKSYTLLTPKVPKKKIKNQVEDSKKRHLNDATPEEWDRVTKSTKK